MIPSTKKLPILGTSQQDPRWGLCRDVAIIGTHMAWWGYIWRKHAPGPIQEEREAPPTAKAITACPHHGNSAAITPMHLPTMPHPPPHVPALRSFGWEERDKRWGGHNNNNDDNAGTQWQQWRWGTADRWTDRWIISAALNFNTSLPPAPLGNYCDSFNIEIANSGDITARPTLRPMLWRCQNWHSHGLVKVYMA